MSSIRTRACVGLLATVAGWAGCHSVAGAPRTPMLLVVRESLVADSIPAYDANEAAIAAICAKQRCPHPYMALTTGLETSAPEVWWLNEFSSEAEQKKADRAWAVATGLLSSMRPFAQRKPAWRTQISTVLMKYRPEFGENPLDLRGSRFLVVSLDTGRAPRHSDAAVYASGDSIYLTVRGTRSRPTADSLVKDARMNWRVLQVRPSWSYPSDAWRRADPDFWRK